MVLSGSLIGASQIISKPAPVNTVAIRMAITGTTRLNQRGTRATMRILRGLSNDARIAGVPVFASLTLSTTVTTVDGSISRVKTDVGTNNHLDLTRCSRRSL